jgi:hypothetical protein
MGKSAPKSPDPKETASAQTATNIGTAIANGYLGNVNQITPDGTLSYSQTGTNKWTDPLSGATYDLPTWTATQTLSPEQKAIKDQNDKAQLNLGTLAANQSGRLDSLLSQPFSISGAPAGGNTNLLNVPNYQQIGSGPQLQTNVGNAGNIQTSLGNAGDITRSYDTDYAANVQQVQDALMQRMQPSLDQNREALETRLRNQGLQPGSQAWDRAVDSATRQENDARFGAILNAGQEQSRLAGLSQQQAAFQNSAQNQAYQQGLASGQFANTAQAQQFQQNLAGAQFGNTANQQMYQNQASSTAANNSLQDQRFNAQQSINNAKNQERATWLNEQYALRNQPINEISALLSGAQVTNPQFVPTQGQSIPNVDYAGLVNQDYQNRLGAYQANQAGIGSVLGGLAGLFTLSDKNAKKDVKKVGGLYEYRYKGEPKNAPKRIGVMAQEVEKVRPNAVRKGKDGFKRVNYGVLFEAGKK